MIQDTIVALATPPGEGGIGILRISGPDAIGIARRIFVQKSGKKPEFMERYFHYGYITDGDGGIIDEVFVVPMYAPRTYTGENVAEIHCHGGMVPINRILKLVLNCGARLAEPGEFTKRAFMNGRIDLAQAEGVMDFIAAKTEEAANASLNQMQGTLSSHIRKIRETLLNILAHMEATIDYPEDDIEGVFIDDLKSQLYKIREDCRELLRTADQGRLIREGIRTRNKLFKFKKEPMMKPGERLD
jgi:tRNA modification GTPase